MGSSVGTKCRFAGSKLIVPTLSPTLSLIRLVPTLSLIRLVPTLSLIRLVPTLSLIRLVPTLSHLTTASHDRETLNKKSHANPGSAHSILHRASNAPRGLTPPRIVILKLRSRLSTPRAGMLRRPTFQPHDPMRANRPATARNLKPRCPTEEKSKRGSVHIPDSGNHLVPAIWAFQCHATSLFLIHIQVCNRSLSHP